MAGLPQTAAKSQRNMSAVGGSHREPWDLNTKLGSPAQSTRTEKGAHKSYVCQGETAENAATLLKLPIYKIPCAATHLGLWQREDRVH